MDTPGQKKAIVFPKTKHRAKRAGIVPITAELQAIIEEALNPAGIARYDPDVPVFNINPLTFNTWWQRLMKSTGIIDLHFHDLRHEATSRLFEQGLSTRQVQTITGHTTNDMADRYAHYSVDELHKVLGGGADADSILDEIAFLKGQYRALTGDINRVAALIS